MLLVDLPASREHAVRDLQYRHAVRGLGLDGDPEVRDLEAGDCPEAVDVEGGLCVVPVARHLPHEAVDRGVARALEVSHADELLAGIDELVDAAAQAPGEGRGFTTCSRKPLPDGWSRPRASWTCGNSTPTALMRCGTTAW